MVDHYATQNLALAKASKKSLKKVCKMLDTHGYFAYL